MRIAVVLFFASASIATFLPCAHPAYAERNDAYVFTKTIYPGASGNTTEALQKRLAQIPGIYPEGKVTGRFDPATVSAVKRLQRTNGLEPTGTLGPKTRALLNAPEFASVATIVSAHNPEGASGASTFDSVADMLLKKIEDLKDENIAIRQSMAHMNRINHLAGTALSNVSVSGITGIAASDLPSIDLASKVSAILPVGNGGTGLSSVTSLQLFAGNAAGTAWIQIATSSLNINTDNLVQGSTNLFYADSLVQSFIHASTTIPKMYTANAFTGANTFSGSLTIGSLSGPLHASGGVVGATTSIGVMYGGTGWTSITSGSLIIGNGSSALATSSNLSWDSTNNRLTVTNLNTTGTATSSIFSTTKVVTTGTASSVSSCGSSPSVIGNNTAGTVTIGSGVVTACTITFGSNFDSTPTCVVTTSSGSVSVGVTSLSSSAMTVGFSATLGSGKIYYICMQTQ